MKILYLGDLRSGQTALMRMRALERLGHSILGISTMDPWMRASWLECQVQRRTESGSIVDGINLTVLNTARQFRPDIVWADKQEFLRIETIDALRDLGARLVHFTPDPYFTLTWKRTRTMDEAFRHFDVLVYCKAYEKSKYQALGKPAIYMSLGYCDESHRPSNSADPRWTCDVGFLGGWEPRREHMLQDIALTGVSLKFRGSHWDFVSDGKWSLRRLISLRRLAGKMVAIKRNDILAPMWCGEEVYGADYASALSGAKIGLGFLRHIVPDQHTTRSFEIPACGSLLLADRTDEHRELFKEGTEAEYFGSSEELCDKVQFYSRNEPARRRVAEAGHRRCADGKYAYIHRLNTTIEAINSI